MCRCSCFFYCSCDHRDLHVLTHSFPTRRSSDLIAPVLKRGDVIILESTSPVGATEQMARWLAEQRSDLRFPANGEEWGEADVAIAHCPERVLPGNILHELVHNDRVVGGLTPACSEAAVALYSSVVQGECIVADRRTAETL